MRAKMLVALLAVVCGTPVGAAEATLAESLPAGTTVRTEIVTTVDGTMTLPAAKDKPAKSLTVAGKSTLHADERSLPHDEKDTDKLLRIYRKVDIERTVDGKPQTAAIRPAVQRLVVLRSDAGKSPFSPDGPLTFGEIDVVKNDLFLPVLVKGLLPGKAVKAGDAWDAGPDAVRELTDIAKVTEGKLTVKCIGPVTFDGKERVRLSVTGTVRGVDGNGPCRHVLDGTAYFDPAAAMLTYLSVKGRHELLDGTGQVAGTVNGRMTVTRSVSPSSDLNDDAVKKLELNPTSENTRLLYENADLGLTLVHPRRWRVGSVQGRQVTLDGPNGAGLLVTSETVKSLPTAAAFLKESQEFIAKAKGTVANVGTVERIAATTLDRFGFDAELGKESLRMEYAVLTGEKGGLTLAARLPKSDATELTKDVDVIAKSLKVTAK